MTIALELAVQDAAGVRVAREVGAARVEFTQALALGGLTPSAAALETALDAAGESGPEIHVLIRPRPGGFQYDADELAVCVRDVERAVAAGAAGVVVGALDRSGALDLAAITRMRDAAGGASVTLHRAIDATADPVASLKGAIDMGLQRVLTSGGASVALDGLETLRAMVAAADGRIEVMAGSGVNEASAPALAASGVDAVHLSAKRVVGVENDGLGFGGHEITDRDIALAVRDALGL